MNNKIIMWSDVYRRGLKFVHQLFANGSFKSNDSLIEEYGLTTLRVNSLKMAIPKEWKEHYQIITKQDFLPTPPHNYDKCICMYKNNFSKLVYNSMADDVLLIHRKYLKWLQDIGTEFCEGLIDFGLEHKNILKLTNVTKYRDFQYRLLQRGLVTNIDLHNWGLMDSNLCSTCMEQEESLVHLLVQCPTVQEFWTKFEEYIATTFPGVRISLTPRNIILSSVVPRNTRNHRVINFLSLITKQYIYRQRCLNKPTIFRELKAIFRKTESIEKYIAQKNGKIAIHNRKWRPAEQDQLQSLDQFIQESILRM